MGYIDFSPLLERLNKSGLSGYSLYTYFGFDRGTVSKLLGKANPGFNIRTIAQFCCILECEPGDLMRYVPTEDDEKYRVRKEEVIQRRTHFKPTQFSNPSICTIPEKDTDNNH